ncbi:heterokaryon incompatibility protein-domain-containing protein [Xylariaceae sp. FL1019]|nr:heterokaryon incompatibility protein-domain-containing protein [Xylariaceae sp. FL1019]
MDSNTTPVSVYSSHILRSSRQFRILTLHPYAEEEDPIQASLSVSTLDDERGKFGTISYVWGSPSLPRTDIFVDGINMQVTDNLAAVMRYLRKPDRSVRIWADGICINQDDMTEKSHQVRLMDRIYSGCSQVNVWLPSPLQTGARTRTTGRAVSLGGLMECFNQEHFHSMPGYTFDPILGQWGFEENEEFRVLWHGFLLLTDSPWWTRAWTAQEAFLPSRVIFLHDQAASFEIQLLYRACKRDWAKGIRHPRCCIEALELFPQDKLDRIRHFWSIVRKIQRCYNGIRGIRPPSGESFYETVKRSAGRKCSVDRDRIYSLWSMAGNLYKHHHSLDYATSDDEVFTSIFKCMLRESQTDPKYIYSCGMDFRVLQGLHFEPSLVPGGNKRPSWVPDFSKNHVSHVSISHPRIYQASGWSKGTFEIRGRELHLKGFFMDKIRAIGPVAMGARDQASFKTALTSWKPMLQQYGVGDATRLGELRLYERLAVVLCAGAYREQTTPRELTVWCLKAILRRLWKVNIIQLSLWVLFQIIAWKDQWRPYRAEKDFPGIAALADIFETGNLEGVEEIYRDSIETALSDRAFYITDNGRMGLAVQHLRVGDEVWGVYGATVPFIFRPLKDSDHESHNLYHMIGDCYLENAMNGELVPLKWRKSKTLIRLV